MAARCSGHPDVVAVATCARCGGFLCGDCVELLEEAPYCGACVAVLTRDEPPSWGIAVARKLGMLGMMAIPCSLLVPVVPLVLGGTCLLLARRELRRIREGERSRAGLDLAKEALSMGWLNLGVLACSVILWGVFVGLALV
ncbi:hypothetical protein LZ198_05365 [Myxococcus sp. K15C18031901]|uniref:hypothetical protein n=1 Tax=Myxococcus dinghuensis TaxID=2906761 RepID=UPI0020A7BBC8|nr:hypothetical protein [Myxococcus dinghuensis]MCP3098306.1 hypothetical protein [Myxococcus dinghuensis]